MNDVSSHANNAHVPPHVMFSTRYLSHTLLFPFIIIIIIMIMQMLMLMGETNHNKAKKDKKGKLLVFVTGSKHYRLNKQTNNLNVPPSTRTMVKQ